MHAQTSLRSPPYAIGLPEDDGDAADFIAGTPRGTCARADGTGSSYAIWTTWSNEQTKYPSIDPLVARVAKLLTALNTSTADANVARGRSW